MRHLTIALLGPGKKYSYLLTHSAHPLIAMNRISASVSKCVGRKKCYKIIVNFLTYGMPNRSIYVLRSSC